MPMPPFARKRSTRYSPRRPISSGSTGGSTTGIRLLFVVDRRAERAGGRPPPFQGREPFTQPLQLAGCLLPRLLGGTRLVQPLELPGEFLAFGFLGAQPLFQHDSPLLQSDD